MRIADGISQIQSTYTRTRGATTETRIQHIQPTGGRTSLDPMMSDGGGTSSRLVNSGLALDSAQSSYERFKSIIDRYV